MKEWARYVLIGGTIGAALVFVAALNKGLDTFSTIMACLAGFSFGGMVGMLGWFAE